MTAVGIDLIAGAAIRTVVGAAMELTPVHTAMRKPLLLMPKAKSLFDLWEEYLNGVGGRRTKTSRLFSQAEQGQVKQVQKQCAIDLIIHIYGGQTSVIDNDQ